jgi:hypothetical protein
MLEMYCEYFFKVILDHQGETHQSIANRDAALINQMMLTKTLHLKRLIENEGVGFKSRNGSELRPIIDPTIVVSLVRNIYETVGLFNLIYINAKSPDEKTIQYSLWALSGLNYRQRFGRTARQESSKATVSAEQKEIERLTARIEGTDLYKGMSEDNRKKIKSLIKDKEYKMRFEGSDVKFLSWQQLTDTLGIREKFFENMYTYFSLYAHPSNVAVFQFEEMFDRSNEQFKQLTITNLKTTFFLLSCFIADYLKFFPNVMMTFNSLPLLDQIMLNFFNSTARGQDFSINDAWKKLGFE